MDDFTSRVDLQKIINEQKLEVLYTPEEPSALMISSSDVNRPGLALAGFFDHFDPRRIQLLGNAESLYLQKMEEEQRRERLTELLRHNPPALIFTDGNKPDELTLELAEYFEVPVLCTVDQTSDFMAALIAYLHVQLAPQITRHGVLVEVYGEGILITGDSGVGKSETAIELIKRGHRLIADDAVEIRRLQANRLEGTAPELIRYYMELRGIGVVDVRRLFGMSAIKTEADIDMVIHLEPWKDDATYDRLGAETQYMSILDVQVPALTIPVKPGRNLAAIIEVAAMNNRNKKMGYNAAQEFTRQLDAHFDRALSQQSED